MSIKNATILILVMVVQILCLGIYTNYVLKDILVSAITTETTKIINTSNNDVKTKIDNHFKKIAELNSRITTNLPVKTNQENKATIKKVLDCTRKGFTLVRNETLTRKQKRENKNIN